MPLSRMNVKMNIADRYIKERIYENDAQQELYTGLRAEICTDYVERIYLFHNQLR